MKAGHVIFAHWCGSRTEHSWSCMFLSFFPGYICFLWFTLLAWVNEILFTFAKLFFPSDSSSTERKYVCFLLPTAATFVSCTFFQQKPSVDTIYIQYTIYNTNRLKLESSKNAFLLRLLIHYLISLRQHT